VSDVRKITGFFDGPKVDVRSSSGMLCVTIHPRPNWLVLALGCDIIFSAVLYYSWPSTSHFGRIIWIVILVSTLISSAYEFLAEEIVEIDSQRLTIRKGIHGWERAREYQIAVTCGQFAHARKSSVAAREKSYPRRCPFARLTGSFVEIMIYSS
jgi:hypothetical protein